MLKQAHFLILLLIFVIWEPAGAQKTEIATPVSQGDSARIIYQVRGRAYIDKGILDGISDSWQVAVPDQAGHTLNLSLSWVGDDVSCFSVPDSLFSYFKTGLIVSLNKLQNQKSPGYKITLAYPHTPALPHEGAVDSYDREFQSLISPNLQISPLKAAEYSSSNDSAGENSDSLNNENRNYDFKCANGDYCESSSINLLDAYYTLQYYKKHPAIESYAIKYLPPLDDPLYIYWDITMNACVPSQATAKEFNGIFNSARFEALMPSPGDPGNNQFDLTDNRDQVADSPPYYGSTYGPYFISEKTNDQIVLLRNKECPTNRALPDSIIIRSEPDYLKRKLMFQLGEIDFLDLHFSDIEQFENNYKVKKTELNEAAYLTINNLKPMLTDGMLMTALSYLINKDGLCRIALGKSAISLDNLIGKWSSGIQPMYKYDKSKGQSLIKNLGAGPRYLSLYISPDDFFNRRTAEYIKGILERQNIYVTIYSKMLEGQGRSYDLFQQFDMMLGRIDLTLDDPMYILNQAVFHYDLDDITKNRSLYYSQDIDSTMNQYLRDPDVNQNILVDYYRSLIEFPAGISLFKPTRQVAASGRIKNFELTKDGFIDFSSIEIKDETER